MCYIATGAVFVPEHGPVLIPNEELQTHGVGQSEQDGGDRRRR